MPNTPITPPNSSFETIIQQALDSQSISSAEAEALIENLRSIAESDQHHIVRGMQLSSDQIIPGLALLHYFSRIIAQKYPAMAYKFTTEQHASHIKLIIETSTDNAFIIEEMLEKFSQILLGKLPLNQLVSEETQLMELKQALDLSVLMVNINQTLAHHMDDFTGKAPGLEDAVIGLHSTIGYGISGLKELQQVITNLLREDRTSITHSLHILRSRLYHNMSESDQKAVEHALLDVKQHEPDVFETIRQAINRHSESGGAGDVLYSWISSLSRTIS
jgi:hypothetical protein